MQLDFTKGNGLIPAIVQDAVTQKVLMLGYMNEEAYRITREKNPCDILFPYEEYTLDEG